MKVMINLTPSDLREGAGEGLSGERGVPSGPKNGIAVPSPGDSETKNPNERRECDEDSGEGMDSESQIFVKARTDSHKCDELEVDSTVDPITCNTMTRDARETGVNLSKYGNVGSIVHDDCLIDALDGKFM